MNSDQVKLSYEQLFILFSAKVEKVLIRFMLGFLLLLLCAQTLIQIPSIRLLVTKADSLEGKPYLQQEEANSKAGSTFKMTEKQ
jgi:hypothetical protein